MRLLRSALIVFGKEIREEARRKESFLASFFFSFISIVLFHFSLDLTGADLSREGSGLLWLIILFAGSLFTGNSFRKEEENGTFQALLLAVSDSGAIFLGKYLANLAFMTSLGFFLLFLSGALLDMPVRNALLPLAFVFTLVNAGYSSLATMISALLSKEKGSALLYPLVLYPLLVPLFMAAAALTGTAMASGPLLESPWLRLLVLFDILFFVACMLLFEYAAEE